MPLARSSVGAGTIGANAATNGVESDDESTSACAGLYSDISDPAGGGPAVVPLNRTRPCVRGDENAKRELDARGNPLEMSTLEDRGVIALASAGSWAVRTRGLGGRRPGDFSARPVSRSVSQADEPLDIHPRQGERRRTLVVRRDRSHPPAPPPA